MHLRTALGILLLASSTSIALAQPGGGGRGGAGGGEGGTDRFIDRWMERDADGDGKISKDEIDGPFAERLFEADADGDGMLTREELAAAIEQMRGGRGGPGAGREGAGRPDQPGEGGPRGGRPNEPGAAGPNALNFHDAMELAGRSMRGLRRSQFNARSREGDLVNVQSLQQAFLAAKGQIRTVPMAPQAEERFGEDQAAYEAEFHMTLVKAMFESVVLEMAILEGDETAIREAVSNLVEVQSFGHDMFEGEHEEEAEEADAAREVEREGATRVRPGNRGGAGGGGDR